MRKRFFTIFSLFMVFLPLELEYDLAFSANFPPSLRREILADFTFLDSIQGQQSSKLHQQIFGEGGLDGRRYTQFLRLYINSLSYTGVQSPYQVQTNGRGHLFIHANYAHFARHVSKFSRAINFIHEARHNSGEHHHVQCPTPYTDELGREIKTTIGNVPLSGLFACDDRVDGSYAIEIIVAKNIERFCENCDLRLRQEAGAYADDLLVRIVGDQARRTLIEDLYDKNQPLKVGQKVPSTEPIQYPKQGFL